MTRRALLLIPLVILGGLVILFYAGLHRDPRLVPSPLVGKPAPAFSLPRLGEPDKTLSRADLEGRVTLLNVWATWCVGCREEHALLVDIARKTAGVVVQNLTWAVAYNLIALPAAALGFVAPWAAALGMSLSSLIVVGNSLRLSRSAKN